jgi:hypothetical protein
MKEIESFQDVKQAGIYSLGEGTARHNWISILLIKKVNTLHLTQVMTSCI